MRKLAAKIAKYAIVVVVASFVALVVLLVRFPSNIAEIAASALGSLFSVGGAFLLLERERSIRATEEGERNLIRRRALFRSVFLQFFVLKDFLNRNGCRDHTASSSDIRTARARLTEARARLKQIIDENLWFDDAATSVTELILMKSDSMLISLGIMEACIDRIASDINQVDLSEYGKALDFVLEGHNYLTEVLSAITGDHDMLNFRVANEHA